MGPKLPSKKDYFCEKSDCLKKKEKVIGSEMERKRERRRRGRGGRERISHQV